VYANFTLCFSFWELSHPDSLLGLCPRTPLGTSVPQAPWPGPQYVNPIYCKVLGIYVYGSNYGESCTLNDRHEKQQITYKRVTTK